MSTNKQALREAELEELNELLREKVKRLEEKLWDTEQLRKVHSEKSFELEQAISSMKHDHQKNQSWLANQVIELEDGLCKLLPGTQYMDPPDGGSVTPLEQVARMVADYREQLEVVSKSEWKLAGDLTESQMNNAVLEKRLEAAEKRIAELTAPDGNAIAWESTTPVYIKFITDERYRRLRPGYQKWYKPYRCSNCAAGISVKGE
ncbi:hypothetical protein E0D81_04910 [Lelliottia amnigena]|uniref:hypothetical protein n=1 Tax=Lelliottia amnigena TaxID=61646 RepID=UPI00103D462F|nr:hypothetical protein [Lelliottia amnigena]TCD25029.1 hypothetical protein E0D81_04910 [Lelliottia amnigena]